MNSLRQHALTLNGRVPSKANDYRIVRRGRGYSLMLTPAARAEIDWLILQANQERTRCGIGKPLIHPDLTVRFRVKRRRQDRDNALKTLLDVLQFARIIRNDNVQYFNGRVVIEPSLVCDTPGVDIELVEEAPDAQ